MADNGHIEHPSMSFRDRLSLVQALWTLGEWETINPFYLLKTTICILLDRQVSTLPGTKGEWVPVWVYPYDNSDMFTAITVRPGWSDWWYEEFDA